jgi:acetoin utilization deacetylase AcuC-like enzyme
MTTKVFVPSLHAEHQPREDLSDGIPAFKHPETPQRIESILSILDTLPGIEISNESGLAEEAVRQLHDPDYVDFLIAISTQLKPESEYIPSIFHHDMSHSPVRFQGGMYCREIGTPIGSGSIRAALNSAATALSAARHVRQTHSDTIALCRPPGHHAGKRRYGGYCFFNNAFLAAKTLSQNSQCCPVLDIDYHFGDGSIEFSDQSMPYFSLHADPWKNYPYLDSREKLDYPHARLGILVQDTDIHRYLAQLSPMLEALSAYSPDYAVLSLGFDTLATDSIQDASINIRIEDFCTIGELIGERIKAPVLILLEGGYDVAHLGDCMSSFLEGFRKSRQE